MQIACCFSVSRQSSPSTGTGPVAGWNAGRPSWWHRNVIPGSLLTRHPAWEALESAASSVRGVGVEYTFVLRPVQLPGHRVVASGKDGWFPVVVMKLSGVASRMCAQMCCLRCVWLHGRRKRDQKIGSIYRN